jgi:hypothetical protein
MARTIDERLEQLRARRRGIDERSRLRLNEDAARELAGLSRSVESWQRRAVTQPNTRYALGAMQAVADDYTRKSRDEADRVGKQLIDNLTIGVETRLQGSVPLDVHIRGVSDVDLLVLRRDFLTYDPAGVRGRDYFPSDRDTIEMLATLRGAAASQLRTSFPAATVDVSGAKCIALSGGSLARPVDVVPSIWSDNKEYQASNRIEDRGVTILNAKTAETIANLPFLHIDRVNLKNTDCLGGLKMAIRLVKNVKNDADDEDCMKLPSFDIAALMYHAERDWLRGCALNELHVLVETRRFLAWCANNPIQAAQFKTPDGLRTVLNTADKATGVQALSREMDALSFEVAKELGVVAPNADWDMIGRILGSTVIPVAA